MIHPVRITEAAIQKYGYRPLSLWAYAYMKCVNGVVYRGCDEQRIEKLGWSRSKFFASMAMLCDAGLAEKDAWGNWRLCPRYAVSKLGNPRHRCTLLLDTMYGDRDVKDALVLKIMEMGHRQVAYRILEPTKQRIRRERVELIEKGIVLQSTTEQVLSIGQPIEVTVKVAKTGYVPMNTDTLLRVTGLGRSALFSWKKRAKANGWIEQVDRCEDLPPTWYGLLPAYIPDIERSFKGAISFSSSRNVFRFHQASIYKPLLSYSK